LEDRLLQPERLETILASVLDRCQERTERRRKHLVELHKRIAKTDQRLNRLFDAIESGVADLDAPGQKERIADLKAIREQTSADAERAQAALDHAGDQAVHPDMVRTFARAARQRIRLDSGGYRRDHLRALAQRVEVADMEVRIMGSKSELLRTLVAASGGKPGVAGVQSSALK
jgi:chromosome segregation ATPase